MSPFPASAAVLASALALPLSSCNTSRIVAQSAGTVTRSVTTSVAGASRATAKATARATSATGQFLGSSARKVAGKAANLWPWKPDDATASPASPDSSGTAPTATAPTEKRIEGFKFPSGPLTVASSEFSPAATQLDNAGVTLPGGWDIKASSIRYELEPDGLTARILLASGKPAAAISSNDDRAEASEIHFRNATGVLLLRGNPVLRSGAHSVRAVSPSTVIKIHLPSGAIAVDGPAQWGQ